MHARLRGSKSLLTLYQIIIIKPDFPSLADEIAKPRPDMNIKVAAFTVSEKSSNTGLYPFKWNTVFGNNIKSKIGILNLIRKICLNQKTLTKKYFLKFVYVFINAGIGWNFNVLNVLCQITSPACTLSDMDQ